jgi:hypothetical protein
MLSAKNWLKLNWVVDLSSVEKMDMKPRMGSSTHSSEYYLRGQHKEEIIWVPFAENMEEW